MLLRLENVQLFYGVVQVLRGVSMDVPQGTIVTLLGANGAGKSTTLKAISGLTPIFRGEILFEGRGIKNMAPEKIVHLGITLIPEGRRLFPELKVVENLRIGGSACRDRAKKKMSLERVTRYFPMLKERGKQRAWTLSGGEQQMLAIGRGIMAGPKLLMIDEPSLGLAPLLVKELMHIIQNVNREGLTILLVEQNAKMALSIAQYGYVLELGRISTQGQSAELLVDEKVKRSYLGMR